MKCCARVLCNRRTYNEEEANPLGHAMTVARAIEEVDADDAHKDGDGQEDHGREQVLAEHGHDHARRRHDLDEHLGALLGPATSLTRKKTVSATRMEMANVIFLSGK